MQGAQRLTAAGQDVGEVHGHASRQGQAQGLHGGGAGAPVAVDHDRRLSRAAAEAQVAVPDQLDLDGRLGSRHGLSGPSWP